MDGDNVTKDGIWTVVELWLKIQHLRGIICESAPLQILAPGPWDKPHGSKF